MDKSIRYLQYKSDLSGSLTKNRFRYELLWGLDKLFEKYENCLDFHILFDLVCDIEVHLPTGYEFYQLKTTKSPTYTISKITSSKKRKDNSLENSILGKLYQLRITDKNYESKSSKLAIVTNVPLSNENDTRRKDLEVGLSSFTQKNKAIIEKKLLSEFPDETDIELSNIYYINSVIPIKNMKELMLGKTVHFFERVVGEELIRPTILYNALYEEINVKACYEDSLTTYSEILEKKAISRNRISTIISAHQRKSHDIIEKCESEIDNLINTYKEKVSLKASLASLSNKIRSNEYIKNIEIKFKNDILLHLEELDDGHIFLIIDSYLTLTDLSFPIEFNNNDKKVFILIILKKIEENIYV